MKIVYKEERIAIRELEITDSVIFAEWWNNGDLMKDVGFRTGMGVTPGSLEKDFAAEIEDNAPFREKRRFVVVDKISHRPIGELVYGNLNMERKSCGIGIKICDLSLQGKGLGYETLVAFMKYLYREFRLDIFEIDTLKDNVRAYGLYKKVGFKEVRVMENFWSDPDGISHDLIFMELGKDEFFNGLH